jgi:hypothetical protein
MQFASPTSLFWLLLAVPIVIFYILKIRLRRVPVSTVMFWNQIFDERKPRSIWQRLRHLISLLLQLAFLALLVFAVADPFFDWEKLTARRVVLVVDNSASMQSNVGTATRLETAKQRGRRLVRGLRIRDQMAIVSAGSAPRVESGLTNHQRTLADALSAIPATDGPTRVAEAVRLARRLLVGHANAQVVVLTDGCFEGADTYNDDESVQLDIIGTATDNVAITQFQVRRSLVDVIGYQILVEVSNFGSEPIECRLEVNLDDGLGGEADLVDVVPIKLKPDERWKQVFDHTSATGGLMMAKLDVQDALAADNQAVALLPRRERQPVLLVTAGNHFLESALAAIPLVDLRVETSLVEKRPAGTIVILDGQSTETIPAGNVMVMQPTTASNLWTLGEPIQDPLITEQDTDSLLMTHVQLENVMMPDARELAFQIEHTVLAASIGGQPLYTAIEHEGGKTLVLTVDLQQGDLPLRTAFPIMMTNAISWFRGEQAELRQSLATGSIVECELSATVAADNSDTSGIQATNGTGAAAEEAIEAVTTELPGTNADETVLALRAPDGSEKRLPEDVERLMLGPLDQCGVWQVIRRNAYGETSQPTSSGKLATEPLETLAQYACNLASAAESDLRAAVDLTANQAAYAGVFGGRPIWFYLTVLGLLLSSIEWCMYQRRWIS